MRFISSTPIELSYRGSVLTPHTRPDRFSSSAITPHSPSEVVARSELSVSSRASSSFVLLFLAACHLALAKDAPLPRAKPPSSRAAYPPSPAPVPEVLPLHDAEAWPSDCALRLAEIARFAHQPSVNGPGQCGASDVVRLEGILMPNRALVTVTPAASLQLPHGRGGRAMGAERSRPGHG